VGSIPGEKVARRHRAPERDEDRAFGDDGAGSEARDDCGEDARGMSEPTQHHSLSFRRLRQRRTCRRRRRPRPRRGRLLR
jgi:hypothetical protein